MPGDDGYAGPAVLLADDRVVPVEPFVVLASPA